MCDMQIWCCHVFLFSVSETVYFIFYFFVAILRQVNIWPRNQFDHAAGVAFVGVICLFFPLLALLSHRFVTSFAELHNFWEILCKIGRLLVVIMFKRRIIQNYLTCGKLLQFFNAFIQLIVFWKPLRIFAYSRLCC